MAYISLSVVAGYKKNRWWKMENEDGDEDVFIRFVNVATSKGAWRKRIFAELIDSTFLLLLLLFLSFSFLFCCCCFCCFCCCVACNKVVWQFLISLLTFALLFLYFNRINCIFMLALPICNNHHHPCHIHQWQLPIYCCCCCLRWELERIGKCCHEMLHNNFDVALRFALSITAN